MVEPTSLIMTTNQQVTNWLAKFGPAEMPVPKTPGEGHGPMPASHPLMNKLNGKSPEGGNPENVKRDNEKAVEKFQNQLNKKLQNQLEMNNTPTNTKRPPTMTMG